MPRNSLRGTQITTLEIFLYRSLVYVVIKEFMGFPQFIDNFLRNPFRFVFMFFSDLFRVNFKKITDCVKCSLCDFHGVFP